MENIYTLEQWQKDKNFNANVGQEITKEVYEAMQTATETKPLPVTTARKALRELDIPVHNGFLMGTPYRTDTAGDLFLAFGMNDYGKGSRYFYLGLSPEEQKLNGTYYLFESVGAFPNDGLFPLSAFNNEKDAIAMALDYEATLYKYEFKDGETVSEKKLYSPAYC